MTDLISREAALAALEWGDIYGRNAQDAIRALPAAQVICTWPSCSHTAKGQCQPLSPTAVDASQMPDPVLTDPRVKALVEQVRALLVAADGESYAAYNAALEATSEALRAIWGEA